MFSNCTTPVYRVNPLRIRDQYRGVRANPIRPDSGMRAAFFDQDNIKQLTNQSIALSDTAGITNSNITTVDVLKLMNTEFNMYQANKMAIKRKRFLHDQTALLPPVEFDGRMSTLTSQRATPMTQSQIENDLQKINRQVIKRARMLIFSRQNQETRAEQLGVGVHAQAGRLGRPQKFGTRPKITRTETRRGIPALGSLF